MARSTRSRFPARRKNNYLWQLSTGLFAAQGTGSVALNFGVAGTLPSTLLRIRGEISGYLDAASAPGLGVEVTYGIVVVPEGQGTTVIWDPVTDDLAPWLLWGTAFLGYEEMVTDVIDVPGITSFRHMIDNKAMRRLKADTELQFVMTNTTVFTAKSVNLAYSLRFLQLIGKR